MQNVLIGGTIKLEWIQLNILNNNDIITNLFYTVIVLIVLQAIKYYAMRVIHKQNYEPAKHFTTRKAVKSSLNFLLIVAILVIWWHDSQPYILSFIGFFTAGMAIAMRDIILNMIGSLYILWASPFKVGDRIEISGQIGDVIDIRLLQFSMLEVGNRIAGEQSTGRMIHLPNMYVFSYPLANYEKGFKFIWNELTVPLDKGSNWEKAKTLILSLLSEHTGEAVEEAKAQIDEAGKDYLIYYNNLEPTIYTEFKNEKIVFSVRYLCEARKVRYTDHLLWESILKTFENHEDIRLG